jgi:hypothetical protein
VDGDAAADVSRTVFDAPNVASDEEEDDDEEDVDAMGADDGRGSAVLGITTFFFWETTVPVGARFDAIGGRGSSDVASSKSSGMSCKGGAGVLVILAGVRDMLRVQPCTRKNTKIGQKKNGPAIHANGR